MPVLIRTSVDCRMKKLILLFLWVSSSVFAGEYIQRTPTDCGPAAVSAVTDRPYEWVLNAFGWHNKENWIDNLHDTPASHYLALQRLGKSYRVVPLSAILDGNCKPEKTVILIHSIGVVNSWLYQHWVVLEAVYPDYVEVWWGDGGFKRFWKKEFIEAYTRGFPNCAYEVLESPRPSWWAWLKGLFGK